MENKRGFIMRNGTCIGMDVQRVYTSTPIGVIQPFASDENIPNGYLLCDGASYAVADYKDLYAVIGNTYGGDTENFNVPNLVDKFIQGSATSGTEKEAGLPNITGSIGNSGSANDQFLSDSTSASIKTNGALSITGYANKNSMANGSESYNTPTGFSFDASKSNAIYGKSNTVQPPALTMVYIIKAFHTNEGTDTGVSDDVIEYVEGEIAEVETALPNIKKFANPGGTAKYITISGATLGDIEVHSAYAGKYMFTSTGTQPIFFGTSTYLGYTLTGWAWNSDKTKLYLRVNGQRDFVISAFGSDGVEISDMTTTAPTDVTFNATFNYNAYIDNSSTGDTTSTWSSSMIASQINNATAIKYTNVIGANATKDTGWNLAQGESHFYGRLLQLDGHLGSKSSTFSFLLFVKANYDNPTTVYVTQLAGMDDDRSNIAHTTYFELGVSSNGNLTIKNKSAVAASYRFI